MRIIGHVSENNRNHFQAVWNRIIGKKLSIIASGLQRSQSSTSYLQGDRLGQESEPVMKRTTYQI